MTARGLSVSGLWTRLRGALALGLVALLGACATVPPGGAATGPAAAPMAAAAAPAPAARPATKGDPFEAFNRRVFGFNDELDRVALKPLAQGYRKVVPEMVRNGVDNVFGNVGDVWSTVNHLLQGKLSSGLRMGMRVATNTTIGLGGLLDPASEMGMDRDSQDLGLTLGHWGVPAGPYLVLPLFGPSDVRDALALPADRYVSPVLFTSNTTSQVAITVLGATATRAGLLTASQMLDDIALDRYQFLRDAYVARRRNQVYDGNPPDLPDDDGPAAAEAPMAAPVAAPTPAAKPAAASAPAPAASAP